MSQGIVKTPSITKYGHDTTEFEHVSLSQEQDT
jgi:hypothetical protein